MKYRTKNAYFYHIIDIRDELASKALYDTTWQPISQKDEKTRVLIFYVTRKLEL